MKAGLAKIVTMTSMPNDKDQKTTEAHRLAHDFELNRLSASFYRNPYPTYHALREQLPQKVLSDGSLFLTRYEDCKAVYADTKTFTSDKKIEFAPKYGDTPLFEHHTSSLVFNDPPLHTRVRAILTDALSPRAIDGLLVGLEKTVRGLLDRMADQTINLRAPVDLIENFASAIPVEVIGNLLAVPIQERGPLRDWSLAILGALEPVLSPEQLERGNRAVSEFLHYLRGLVKHRTLHPLDPQADVLTRLIQSTGNADGLTEKELLHNCIFLLNAGHETTTNLIGNGLEALDRFPSQKQLLIQKPELLRSAIEEFLRFESSNQLGNRRAVSAFTLAGRSFPAQTRIHIGIGAANRDPSVFSHPDELDIGRSPNRHLAFGFGAHVCAGLNLARLEGRVAIAAWLARFPNYQVVRDHPNLHLEQGGRARFRGFKVLPVQLG
jgi:cytochrome P450